MYSKHRVLGECREKYYDNDRQERSERRRRSQDRDRKCHRRHRSKSYEGRKHSRSKSPKKNMSRRRKPSLYWDVPAPGFEHMTPVEYKALLATGQILKNPLLPDVPSKAPVAETAIVRQARRLYVGNIPFGVTEDEMIEFFNQKIHLFGLAQTGGNPVIGCKINIGRNYAFLEFRSAAETTQSMFIDGTYFKGHNLKIRRPHEYQTTLGVIESKPITLDMMKHDSSLFGFTGSHNKLFIGGIPGYFNEDQVKDLLTQFGQLKIFNLVRDYATCLNKGYAFCEYADGAITDQVIAGLNGKLIEGKKMIVRRANTCRKGNKIEQSFVPNQVPGLAVVETVKSPTEVLCLMNMLTPNELKNYDEYEEILEDIRVECSKYGGVRSLKAPRPIEGINVPGCGKVFIEFNSFEDCQKTFKGLSGKIFNNRVMLTSYMEPEKYHRNEF